MSQMRHDYCRAHDLRVAGLLAYASQPMAAPPPLVPVYPHAGQTALRQRALRWPLAAIFDRDRSSRCFPRALDTTAPKIDEILRVGHHRFPTAFRWGACFVSGSRGVRRDEAATDASYDLGDRAEHCPSTLRAPTPCSSARGRNGGDNDRRDELSAPRGHGNGKDGCDVQHRVAGHMLLLH